MAALSGNAFAQVTANVSADIPSYNGAAVGISGSPTETGFFGGSAPLPAVSLAPGLPGSGSLAPIPQGPPRLLIVGPPGSGKSTHGRRLAEDLGFVHISVGDLLREYAQTHPDVKETMDRGQLVDSALVLGLVDRRLSQADVQTRGFLLDGFPRRLEEARFLDEKLKDAGGLHAIIRLDVPEEELRRRIQGRGRSDDSEQVFRDRMAIYHAQTEPVLRHFQGRVPLLVPDLSSPDKETNYAAIRASLGGLFDGRP